MVTLSLTSLIGLVLWQGAIQVQRVTDKMSVHSHTTMLALQIERSLRDQTGRICIPYWIGSLEPLVHDDAGKVEIPFYEGEAETFLVVEHADVSLLIGVRRGEDEDTSRVQHFDGVFRVNFTLIESEAGEPLGIQYQLYTSKKKEQPIVIKAGFGSNPFWATIR